MPLIGAAYAAPNKGTQVYTAVILLPVHPAYFTHTFVSGMQSFFLFQRVPGCNGIADLSWIIVFWTQKFAVGLIDMENNKS